MSKHSWLVLAVAAFAVAPSGAQSAPQIQWVGTWATAPMPADGSFNLRPLSGVTLREIVHISAGGGQIFAFHRRFAGRRRSFT